MHNTAEFLSPMGSLNCAYVGNIININNENQENSIAAIATDKRHIHFGVQLPPRHAQPRLGTSRFVYINIINLNNKNKKNSIATDSEHIHSAIPLPCHTQMSRQFWSPKSVIEWSGKALFIYFIQVQFQLKCWLGHRNHCHSWPYWGYVAVDFQHFPLLRDLEKITLANKYW